MILDRPSGEFNSIRCLDCHKVFNSWEELYDDIIDGFFLTPRPCQHDSYVTGSGLIFSSGNEGVGVKTEALPKMRYGLS